MPRKAFGTRGSFQAHFEAGQTSMTHWAKSWLRGVRKRDFRQWTTQTRKHQEGCLAARLVQPRGWNTITLGFGFKAKSLSSTLHASVCVWRGGG